ncbi:glycoside hydrolase family 9 protein [Sporocytophaga myxococcoides]|uniref:glycoside hydrolase family 9 protein n=1 Tax=Sporocytophaga myxococcoides TaxID=153721 RepID=UPI00048DB621|nr:glycoside hydrolase family 9 protein [Sporocytophaga myxococcoides]
MKKISQVLFILTLLSQTVFSQTLTNADYQKALWMTTRFYGAQRSGENNWLLYNHLPTGVPAALRGRAFIADADGAYDLSGGWHDCGDHVKFGQTQYYSAYLLLKGYAEFKTGYDDRYSFDYQGYKAANKWNFEDNAHDPNCIPDVLDEMKHEAEFLIKCIPNSTTFYYQIGKGGCPGDHCRWETAVKMQTNDVNNGGQPRPIYKNPQDASMPSFCGATLALMSRVYKKFDATFAATCLQHAVYAYNYAKANPGTVGSAGGGQYGAKTNWKDDFATLCAELYWATGNVAYRTEAISQGPITPNMGYTFDYANTGEIALYNLAVLGDATSLTTFNNRITGHFLANGSRNGLGVYNAYGGGWGALRYNANSSFLIALYCKLNNNYTAPVLAKLYADIDYIMGGNANKRSYIVGFVPGGTGYISPLKPHHRNAYLRDDNPANTDNSLTIPIKNQQLGALVGGKRDGTYNDNRDDYVNSEVGIDYNAGLVGALGFINSRVAPIDTNKFCGNPPTCSIPSLGADINTCGSSFPFQLNSNTSGGSSIRFTWKKISPAASVLVNNSSNAADNKYSVTAANGAGTYVVIRDSLDAANAVTCTKSDTIIISSTLPLPVISPTGPINLCNPSSVDLTVSNGAAFPASTTWQWSLDGNSITGEEAKTLLNVRKAGVYKITASISGCAFTESSITITSSLPIAVDGCASTAPINLSIASATGGPYNWYATSTSTTPLATGVTTYNAPAAGTYYVQDMSSTTGSVGQVTSLGSGTNWGVSATNMMLFTVTSDFTLHSFKVPLGNINENKSATITVEILNNSGNSFTPAKTFTSDPVNITMAMANSLITFNFTGFDIKAAWGPNLRMKVSSLGINADILWNSTGAGYPYVSNPSGIVSITGSAGGNNDTDDYMYFYDWKISTGNNCSRLPVIATTGAGCMTTPVRLLEFKGIRENNMTSLSWITASEENSSYFEIQRSTNGTDFNAIGQVHAAGTSSSVIYYTFEDSYPVNGLFYYRLKQVDIDGSHELSKIVYISNEDQTRLSLVPNPFQKSSQLSVVSPYSSSYSVYVVDLSGMIVETIENLGIEDKVEIGASLSSGMYLLKVVVNGKTYHLKMVKN